MVKPWYKQFWPWFLIALPLIVVIATVYRISLLLDNKVNLVAEDYYKKGKGINVDLTKINVAKELGLNATVSSAGDTILITLQKGQLPPLSGSHCHFYSPYSAG